MIVLVTGGASYVGSHTCVELLDAGHEVFVADIRDSNTLDKVFNNFKPEAVIHFAELKAVGESVADPLKYYEINVVSSISLLTAMSKTEFNYIVFCHLQLFMASRNICHMMKNTQLAQ